MTTCSKCGRPAWKPTGGMGGGLMPDDETNCLHGDGRSCRIARAGYVAGLLAGVELAKREVVLDQGNGWGAGGATIDWSDVDTEAAKMAGEG